VQVILTESVTVDQVDDEKVVSGSYDKTLKVWDIKTGRCRRTLRYMKLYSRMSDEYIRVLTQERAGILL